MTASGRPMRINAMISRGADEVRAGVDVRSKLPAEQRSQVHRLCSAKVQGYREVLLTAVVAWLDGVHFNPCDGDFYECKPRAVFEKGIRPALVTLGLKSRKSGPLNVAKAQRKLDESWAASRDDPATAMLVVVLLRWIVASPSERARIVLFALLAELIDEAGELKSLSIAAPTSASATETCRQLVGLIARAPNAGNTAQLIVHAALKILHEHSGAQIDEIGRASETNLTSKKPADVSVAVPWSRRIHLYEITTKMIDENRIRDSDESVLQHGDGANCVTWLCIIPDNISTLKLVAPVITTASGVRHEFVDLRQWLATVIELLGEDRRNRYLGLITQHINNPQTDGIVKTAWREIHKNAP